MGTPLRKTPKGLEEIETRAHKLPPRARQALIMVDGRRDLAQLIGLLGAAAEPFVVDLIERGFVEPVLAAAAAPTVAAAPATATPGSPAPAARLTPAQAMQALPARQRAAARLVVDLIGPTGDEFALRLERCRSPEDFRQAVLRAAHAVGAARSVAEATAFNQRFLADWP